MENNGLAKNIQDALNDYEAKLSGLRAALQEASTQAKQATGLNRENERALESLKVRSWSESARFSYEQAQGSREL